MQNKFDYKIFLALIFLSIFGLVNLLGLDVQIFKNQLINFIIGWIGFFVIYQIGINFFQINIRLFYWIVFGSLVAVYIFGEEVRGSRRWIDLIFFSYQPSEFLKLFYILYLSEFLSIAKKIYEEKGILCKQILLSVFIFVLPIYIILKQPDLGSSLVYISIFIGLLFFSGFSIKYFLFSFIGVALSFPFIWHFLKSYQQNRLLSFFNPNIDPSGIAYNAIQSTIAIGSGGFFGKGLGSGTQSRLSFLPENHTDFVFASFIEQFGFFGGVILISIFFYIIYRLFLKLQANQNNRFNYLVILGVIIYLFTQFFINTGMNMGLLPVTGIPLPLISYGGSSVLSTLLIFGLVLRL